MDRPNVVPLLLVLLLVCTSACGPTVHDVDDGWTTVAERLGDWAFLTPIPQLPPLRTPAGATLGVKAGDCRPCHAAVYREWEQSTHAMALHDLQYLAEIAKDDSPRWLCLNCHIPVQNQRRYLVTPSTRLLERDRGVRFLEQVPNPAFDAAMQDESVTCASCHVRLDAEGHSVVVGPRGDQKMSPHPVKPDRAGLRSVCLRCHSPGQARITPTFFCWFETADELAAGPYAGERDCVDCHMPPDDTGRAGHHWIGGGVPKTYHGYDGLLARGWQPGLEVWPAVVSEDRGLRVRVEFANARAGHWLPTADPERFLLLEATLQDADGNPIERQRLRIGQRWDWGDLETGRPARRIDDNRLRPQERRTWDIEFPPAPPGARLVVSARHVRLTASNAEHMRQTPVDELEPYLEGVSRLLPELERHYPFFTWIHHEELALDDGTRSSWSPKQLIAASKNSSKLDLEALAELTTE